MAALALGWGSAGASLAAEPPARPAMHESATPSPAPDHSGHDMSDMTEDEMAEHGTAEEPGGPDDHGGHDQHGGTPDPVSTVSSGTRAVVLGGVAAVNAGVLGGALLLRRHDRRRPRHTPRMGRAVR